MGVPLCSVHKHLLILYYKYAEPSDKHLKYSAEASHNDTA